MKILITGGSGFVGKNLARYFSQRGHEVIAPTHHEMDLSFKSSICNAMRKECPDWVFHCAAKGGSHGSYGDPDMVEVNVDGTRWIADEARACGVKVFIHAGSSSEYGAHTNCYASEERQAYPTTLYGYSKLAATEYVSYMARTTASTRFTTLRIFSAYGPHEASTRFVPAAVNGALLGHLPPFQNPPTRVTSSTLTTFAARSSLWLRMVQLRTTRFTISALVRSGGWGMRWI